MRNLSTLVLFTIQCLTDPGKLFAQDQHRPDRGGDVSGNTYCHPSFFNDGSTDHFIDGVAVGSISTVNTGFTSDDNGWNDKFFDGTGTVTWLEKGTTFFIAVSTGTAMNSHYYGWVDQDRDEVFEATEYIGHFQSSGSGTQGTLSFTLPASVPTGYTGLRILCSSELTANPDPCGGYAYGEAEDYAVLLAPASPCAPVHTEGTTQGDFIGALLVDNQADVVSGAAGLFPYRTPVSAFHLDAGTSHDLIIASGDYATDRYMAWVDWNNDDDWDDAGELVGEVLSTAPLTAYLLEMNVPDTVWGWFTLRVRCADSEVLAPCNDETYGETRDYMIVVDNPLLPCLTYNYGGSSQGLGIQSVNVNGSIVLPPSGTPNHVIKGCDPVVHVPPGGEVIVQVTANAVNEGVLHAVFADLNADLDFDDPLETVGGASGTAPFQISEYTFTVPLSATPGGHFIRVVSYGTGVDLPAPCLDPVEGHVLDIMLFVDQAGGACIPGSVAWTSEGDFIDGVQLGDVNNIGSGAQYSSPYQDFTALSTDLEVGATYTATITGGEYTSDDYTVWIDYNGDGDFADANEAVGSVSASQSFQEMPLTVAVPTGVPLGPKRMRVRCVYDDDPDPCADSYFGETEDYTVNIVTNTGVRPAAEGGWSVQVVNGGEGIMVRITDDALTGATVQLIDAGGRIVRQFATTETPAVVSLEDLRQGLYTMRLSPGNSISSRKIMITR